MFQGKRWIFVCIIGLIIYCGKHNSLFTILSLLWSLAHQVFFIVLHHHRSWCGKITRACKFALNELLMFSKSIPAFFRNNDAWNCLFFSSQLLIQRKANIYDQFNNVSFPITPMDLQFVSRFTVILREIKSTNYWNYSLHILIHFNMIASCKFYTHTHTLPLNGWFWGCGGHLRIGNLLLCLKIYLTIVLILVKASRKRRVYHGLSWGRFFFFLPGGPNICKAFVTSVTTHQYTSTTNLWLI